MLLVLGFDMLALVLLACSDGPWEGLPEDEVLAREALRSTPITVTGIVLDHDGTPIPDAQVWLRDTTVFTAADGSFAIEAIRHNGLVHIAAAHHGRIAPHSAFGARSVAIGNPEAAWAAVAGPNGLIVEGAAWQAERLLTAQLVQGA